MADYTHHVHQLLSHTNKEKEHYKRKWHGMVDHLEGLSTTALTLAEVSAGAFIGGAIEGKTKQGTFLHVPINLGAGLGLAFGGVAAHLTGRSEWLSKHLINLGTGMIASYTAAAGYSLGKKWLETGSLWGSLKVAAPAPMPHPPPPIPMPPGAVPHPAAVAGY